MMNKINLKSELNSITELWTLKEIGKVNDHVLRIAKLKGEYEMHQHDNGEKLFFVVEGILSIEFPDETVKIQEGEFIIVPKGVAHKLYSTDGVSIMLFEPK